MTWHVISTREVVGSPASGVWTEYLCFRRAGANFELAACLEQIEEVPREWYDDDGELRPEFSDEYGGIKLPVEIGGQEYGGYDGEYLTGALTPHPNYGEISVRRLDAASVSDALERLDWDVAETKVVLDALGGGRGTGLP